MLLHAFVIIATLALTSCDVSHILDEEHTTTTQPPPPRPYFFSYAAGRYPGHVDRQHTEVSDGNGVVKGKYAYVDPGQNLRVVDYTADRDGFHPILNIAPPDHPTDSEAVAAAKNRHYELYHKIAEDHAHHPHPDPDSAVPHQSVAVQKETAKHLALFRVIAEQHARIAAEREALQREEEERQHLQELVETQASQEY